MSSVPIRSSFETENKKMCGPRAKLWLQKMDRPPTPRRRTTDIVGLPVSFTTHPPTTWYRHYQIKVTVKIGPEVRLEFRGFAAHSLSSSPKIGVSSPKGHMAPYIDRKVIRPRRTSMRRESQYCHKRGVMLARWDILHFRLAYQGYNTHSHRTAVVRCASDFSTAKNKSEPIPRHFRRSARVTRHAASFTFLEGTKNNWLCVGAHMRRRPILDPHTFAPQHQAI
jgi:hypothetical protein